MQDAGRLAAAIDILSDYFARRVPLKTALADWARGARYAGAKDRAWISGLCLDALRRRNSLAQAMGEDTARALALGAMRFLWEVDADTLIALAAEEPHGLGALRDAEKARLGPARLTPIASYSSPCAADEIAEMEYGGAQENAPSHIAGDFPEWMTPYVERVFGARAGAAMAAFAQRADVDLRLSMLKAAPEKALSALKTVKAKKSAILTTAARIEAPDPSMRAPAVTVIPAFNKGWVEVQDLGSQIAAAAAGEIKGAQVLDYCAGGGGKTLALAALMENTGQLYAYDRDARRLKPLYHRAKRAGVRNLQIINPSTDREALAALQGKMDVVFVDAPCTGAGTWRRHPDTKWRLSEKQLAARIREQDIVLIEAEKFVKPGGRMIWVTCSFLMEENEDRLAAFLSDRPEFEMTSALDHIAASGLLTDKGAQALKKCETTGGALRLTPHCTVTDGFFIAILQRQT